MIAPCARQVVQKRQLLGIGIDDGQWFKQLLCMLMDRHNVLLVAAFYASNQTMPFAGFKTMPNRHRHLRRMINEHDIQVITLVRRDIASTIASFIAATDSGVCGTCQ